MSAKGESNASDVIGLVRTMLETDKGYKSNEDPINISFELGRHTVAGAPIGLGCCGYKARIVQVCVSIYMLNIMCRDMSDPVMYTGSHVSRPDMLNTFVLVSFRYYVARSAMGKPWPCT
jgi:hypothetical protein